jgi:hypothetical protein
MKKTIIVLITIISVLFVAVLYLLFLNLNKTTSVITSTSIPKTGIIPTDKISPTAIPTLNPTANWKTISNKLWTFKVPTNLNYFQCNSDPSNQIFVGVPNNPNGRFTKDQTIECDFDSPGDLLNIFRMSNNSENNIIIPVNTNPKIDPVVSEVKTIKVGGNQAIFQKETTQFGQGIGSRYRIYFDGKTFTDVITFNDISQKDLFNQILSTFKFTDTSTTTTQLSPQIGYIKNIYTKNSKYYIDIDYVQWVNDSSQPNGFKIVNDNSLIKTLELNQQALITLIDWTDKGMTTPKISFDEFIRVFKQTSPEFNISNFATQPFDITFDKDGLVNKISLRYTP